MIPRKPMKLPLKITRVGSWVNIVEADDEPIICTHHGVFAEAAVRGINCHDELVAALEDSCCPACNGRIGDPDEHPEIECACDFARAVLARAKGETP